MSLGSLTLIHQPSLFKESFLTFFVYKVYKCLRGNISTTVILIFLVHLTEKEIIMNSETSCCDSGSHCGSVELWSSVKGSGTLESQDVSLAIG